MIRLAAALLLTMATAHAQIPADAARWRHEITRQSQAVWGINAPIATFAGQVQQESAFNPQARSGVGAQGLAQFMPATAVWIAQAYPALGSGDPFNPSWALRALATYNRYLWDRAALPHDAPCERAAFMLSAYNGGEGARNREADLCLRDESCDPDKWFDNVEKMRWRAPQFWNENRGYVRTILKRHEPNYVKAGWGRGLCEGAK